MRYTTTATATAALSTLISLPFPLSSRSSVSSRNRNFETPRSLKTRSRLHDSIIIVEGTVLESSLFRSLFHYTFHQREITYGERERERERERGRVRKKKQKLKPCHNSRARNWFWNTRDSPRPRQRIISAPRIATRLRECDTSNGKITISTRGDNYRNQRCVVTIACSYARGDWLQTSFFSVTTTVNNVMFI